METTLILFKPDCVTKGHCGEVLQRFEKAGFRIRGCKMMRLGDALVREHYAHIADKPFFPEVETFMQSSPVIAMALEAEGVIEKVRPDRFPEGRAWLYSRGLRGRCHGQRRPCL